MEHFLAALCSVARTNYRGSDRLNGWNDHSRVRPQLCRASDGRPDTSAHGTADTQSAGSHQLVWLADVRAGRLWYSGQRAHSTAPDAQPALGLFRLDP